MLKIDKFGVFDTIFPLLKFKMYSLGIDLISTPLIKVSLCRDESMGIKNRATPRDAKSENTTVKAISPNICPATPSTNTIGKNTAMVVKVDAVTAPPTSLTPRTVASIRLSPSSLHRAILSRTTMELSTSIPMPSASPPRDIIFKDTSKIFMGANVATIEMGMAKPIIRVGPMRRRKINNTRMANNPPYTAVFFTSSIEFLIKMD